VLISAILFCLGGWPFASLGLALVGLTIGLQRHTPNPRAFAAEAVIAMPIAALLAGVTEFLILDASTSFRFWRSAWRRSSSPAPCCRPAPIRDWPRPHIWRSSSSS